jgi:hypothetical protein
MSKRKKSKHKESVTLGQPTGPMAIAAGWPLYEVLLARGWTDPTQLTTILVARRSPDSGKVAAAYFIVDLACLGVKRVHVKRFKDVEEYVAVMRSDALERQPMAPADLDLVAKIIYTGLAYAGDLGFKPDFVFTQAEPLLGDADPARCPTPVPTGGPEGKPFFINGPYDDVDRVIAQLTRAVGVGNFTYLIQAGPEGLGLLSEID